MRRRKSSVGTPRQQRVEARCRLVADDVLPSITRWEAKSQPNQYSVFTPEQTQDAYQTSVQDMLR
jgi:hypothetical protein